MDLMQQFSGHLGKQISAHIDGQLSICDVSFDSSGFGSGSGCNSSGLTVSRSVQHCIGQLATHACAHDGGQ